VSKGNEKGKLEVQWTTREMKMFKRPGETKTVTAITYTSPGRPPRTVWIDKEKPSDDEIKKAIKDDLEKRKTPELRKATL